ncbi:MAG: 3-dehydroquinate synthase [Pseudomonadota bacterium]
MSASTGASGAASAVAVTDSTADQDTGLTRIEVALGARSYPIVIGPGAISQVPALLDAVMPPGARVAIVTDDNVAAHHLTPMQEILADRHVLGTVVVAPGEASKSFPVLSDVCDQLLALEVERNDCIIALGGGVVGDLVGFASAILRRGVGFIQVPTSLLAQVDSSVGGKTGINTPRGKNLIGAFHQPAAVAIDTATLSTLSPRELRAGYAEVVKYGLLGDAAFFDWLDANGRDVLAAVPAAVAHAVRTSVAAKAAVVASDEREQGARALLNLGHTFGHALEAHAGYDGSVLHGEAISVGMVLAFEYSARLGLSGDNATSAVRAHFDRAGLPTAVSDLPWDKGRPSGARMLELMRQDKKMSRGQMTLILVRSIGDAFVARDVDTGPLSDYLVEVCAG